MNIHNYVKAKEKELKISSEISKKDIPRLEKWFQAHNKALLERVVEVVDGKVKEMHGEGTVFEDFAEDLKAQLTEGKPLP